MFSSRNFFKRKQIFWNSLTKSKMYTKSAPTVDECTLLPYNISVGVERFTGKSRLYIYIVLTKQLKLLKCVFAAY